MVMPLAQMLPLLRCPRSHTCLHLDGEALISETGERYPIVDGKPVLVRHIAPMHINPPSRSLVSKNIDVFVPWPELAPDATVLHLGSGDVPAPDPRVISMDVLPTGNVDLVAEAEALPLKTCSVDLVVSGAVFEHLFDPVGAAAEVHRVLKEEGRLWIDTAFMQSYHGFPSHYFNMTPQAVETFLVDGFILEHSSVPDSGTVLYSITALFDRFLELLPTAHRRRLNKMSLEDVLMELRRDQTHRNPLLREFSEYRSRALASSFVVVGRKPAGYDSRTRHDDQAKAIRRSYYQARVAVMYVHSEACFYARAATELGTPPEPSAIPALRTLLAVGDVSDPTDLDQVESATKALEASAASLAPIRDHWIRKYLALSQTNA